MSRSTTLGYYFVLSTLLMSSKSFGMTIALSMVLLLRLMFWEARSFCS